MSYFSTTKHLVNICWFLLTSVDSKTKWNIEKVPFLTIPREFQNENMDWKSQQGLTKYFCQKLWRLGFLNSCQPSFCEIWWWFWVNLNFSMKINIFQNHEKTENMMMIHNFIECVFQNTYLWTYSQLTVLTVLID